MAMEVWLNLDGVNWAAIQSEPDGSFKVKAMLEYEGHSFDVATYEYKSGFFFDNVPLTTPKRFRARDYNEYRQMNVNEGQRDAERDRLRLERAQAAQAQWDRQQAEGAGQGKAKPDHQPPPPVDLP